MKECFLYDMIINLKSSMKNYLLILKKILFEKKESLSVGKKSFNCFDPVFHYIYEYIGFPFLQKIICKKMRKAFVKRK